MPGRRKRPGPFSRDQVLLDNDRRTHGGRLLAGIQNELVEQLGGKPSAAERLLIQSASLKAVRISLLAERLVTGAVDADEKVISWMNSMRLDLVALGLQNRESKDVVDLESYLNRKTVGSAR